MALNFLALAVFLAVIATAAVLLWRRLPRAAAAVAGEPVCLACGLPARLLHSDTFICPACRCDVRAMGIALARPRAFAGPFWKLVVFSAVLCAMTLFTSALAVHYLPSVRHYSVDENWEVEGGPYQRLEIGFSAEQTTGGPIEGELHADLILNAGELVELEADSPSLRYRLIDSESRDLPVPLDTHFDEAAVQRWMASGGLDMASQEIHAWALGLFSQMSDTLALKFRSAAPRPVRPDGIRDDPSVLFSGAGSTSTFSGPPSYAAPIAMIGWSIVWLAGLWFILWKFGEHLGAAVRGDPARSACR